MTEKKSKGEFDPDRQRSIPFYVIKSALKTAKNHDEYVVVRSDNDYQFARTLDEANTLAEQMREQIDFLSGINHSVQVIELQVEPPEA